MIQTGLVCYKNVFTVQKPSFTDFYFRACMGADTFVEKNDKLQIMKTTLTLFAMLLALSFSRMVLAENPNPDKKVIISGRVLDGKTGESLIGVSVYIKELSVGSVTNLDGQYSIQLFPGTYTLVVSYIGYETIEKTMVLKNNASMDFTLQEKALNLSAVEITDHMVNDNVESNQMSMVSLKVEQIKSIPALMGEVDVIKVIQMLPGVQSSGEGFSGYNVRGGGSEQNLILLDGATVYNASHLMGFFSVFNNDAISDAKLYKGDIPASAGGRLSSLLEVKSREGKSKKINGTAGIGTISSRLSVELPLMENKCYLVVSGRRSYADMFLPLAKDTDVQKNKLYFYDLNANMVYKLNPKNTLYVSGYSGKDYYTYNRDFSMFWGNRTFSARWNHVINKRWLSNVTFHRSNYRYRMTLSEKIEGFRWDSGINDYGVKADVSFFKNSIHTIKLGAATTYHSFNMGEITPESNESILPLKMPACNALEHGAYVSSERKWTDKLSTDLGLRLSVFQNIGSATIYHFDNNHNSIDSSVYEKGKIFNTYAGLEPRFSVKYELSKTASLKAGYSRSRQYVQLASNSQGGTPLDLWFPSNPNVKPQIADQLAIGYFKNLRANTIEASVELYYKFMDNAIDFKDHAQLLLNEKLDGELRFGQARAYGAEFFVRKQTGKLTGWISYTLSKSERKIYGINDGKYYNSNYDKTHNISLIGCYDLSDRVRVAATWVYATGAPVTFPTGRYEFGGVVVPVYSERNGYRLPDYHRLDLSLTLKARKKEGRRIEGEWNFSIYNAYYRKNTFSISFQQNPDKPEVTEAYKVYLFPIIPAVTYNLKF